MVEMVGENTGDVKNTRKCQGAVSCHARAGRNGQQGKENAVLLRVAFRQALSGGACIASNQAPAYKHISGQCAEEMLRGGRGGQGVPSTLQHNARPPPPQCHLVQGKLGSIFSNRILASNHEIRHRPVAVAVPAVTVTAWHLARRSIAPPMNSSIEPLPERLVVVTRSTRSAMDGSEVGCVEHTHTHTCGVSL